MVVTVYTDYNPVPYMAKANPETANHYHLNHRLTEGIYQ